MQQASMLLKYRKERKIFQKKYTKKSFAIEVNINESDLNNWKAKVINNYKETDHTKMHNGFNFGQVEKFECPGTWTTSDGRYIAEITNKIRGARTACYKMKNIL